MVLHDAIAEPSDGKLGRRRMQNFQMASWVINSCAIGHIPHTRTRSHLNSEVNVWRGPSVLALETDRVTANRLFGCSIWTKMRELTYRRYQRDPPNFDQKLAYRRYQRDPPNFDQKLTYRRYQRDPPNFDQKLTYRRYQRDPPNFDQKLTYRRYQRDPPNFDQKLTYRRYQRDPPNFDQKLTYRRYQRDPA